MTENLEELQAKLQKSKEQLKRVKQTLATNPHSDNLLALKKDLEEVISLTEKVVQTKVVKTYDPIKDNQLKQQQQATLNSANQSIDINLGKEETSSMTNDINSNLYPHDEEDDNYNDGDRDIRTANVYNVNSNLSNEITAGVHDSTIPNTINETKAIPREWGVEKSHYEIGERCQVKYETDRRWYMAVVTEVISDAAKEELILNNSNNNNSSNASKLSKYQWYRVRFLDNSQEYNTCTKFMRTYVPPLLSQVHVGSRIKAIWDEDGMFHRAVVEEIQSDGRYGIKFDGYNTKSVVSLYDIQLCGSGSGKGAAAGTGKHSSFRIEKDKKGFLAVDEKPNIPPTLWKKKDENEGLLERRKRLKRIKSIKRKHEQLKEEIDRKNKQHSWQRFQSKGIKKAQKKLHGSLLRPTESIFQSPLDNEARVGIGRSGPKMTSFEERTHFHHLKKDPKEYPHLSNTTAITTQPTPQLIQIPNNIPMASLGINNFNLGMNVNVPMNMSQQQWQSIPSTLPSIINNNNINMNDPHSGRMDYFRQ